MYKDTSPVIPNAASNFVCPSRLSTFMTTSYGAPRVLKVHRKVDDHPLSNWEGSLKVGDTEQRRKLRSGNAYGRACHKARDRRCRDKLNQPTDA
jgi:hypothetical protein